MLKSGYHLSYCTNIHPGESWQDTFHNIKLYIPKIKQELSPNTAFGIGLRLSDLASRELLEGENLIVFKTWLDKNSCYVFTLNGFPFGGFHHQSVKDKVHQPDWTTIERLEYTVRLFDILQDLLPHKIDGGISTSPLSYKYWSGVQDDKKRVFEKATLNIIKIAEKLYKIHQGSDQLLHLDIEPEPDGLLENTSEVIDWYQEWLIPMGINYLKEYLDLSEEDAKTCLKSHIRLCYDVCHFAIVYEKPEEVFALLKSEKIKIGKIQLSAALKASIAEREEERELVREALTPFVESTYLHQVVERDSRGQLSHYRDLPQALEKLNNPGAREWRTHFHVPVFLKNYGRLESTQDDILQVLNYLKKEKVTNHLEVETYTWEVLPREIQLEMTESIVRELQWVKKNL
ncbi:metabolite traffic protein EboE [Salegentibacter sp. JZCK2]|uniref:metabolite traffic protein EboE n=1 Tax=Salegentibacter tibetensis TaxID=2873600 RepID=UPI001CCE4016|nr:metabolite traffic protein EboE [Salegentibacter tibetensis]MBZ9731439.1 metabolite traffic protein EboE [Salegentibacter tibetensis]